MTQVALREPRRNEDLGQWMTDPRLARALVRWAGVRRGEHVLEPGAGSGNLIEACLEAGAHVTALELDPRWCAFLRQRFRTARVGVHRADFLAGDTYFGSRAPTLSVLNPPFEDDQEGRWIAEAVARTGRAAAIIRLHGLAGITRLEQCWARVRLTRAAVCVPRPPFHGSGVHEICVVECVPRARPRSPQGEDVIRFGHLHWQEGGA
ncbi:MAG: hypothetical protein K8H88_06340 [Sandaracinaceae bacterium]|nr:hypothetical protein [Sandaracinaceae bacterium]